MQKIIITISAFTVGILLFAALALVPLLAGISGDSRELEAAYTAVSKASLVEQETADYASFARQQSQNFQRFNDLLVDPDTPVGFIEFLESIAASSNLELKIFPNNPRQVKGERWPLMDFQLTSSASYPQFAAFLTKLENAPYLLEVRNTTLTRARATTGQESIAQDINFTLQVQVFTEPLTQSSP